MIIFVSILAIIASLVSGVWIILCLVFAYQYAKNLRQQHYDQLMGISRTWPVGKKLLVFIPTTVWWICWLAGAFA